MGAHVLILGLGLSGLAMARWRLRQGDQVTVADTREAPPQRASLPEGVRFAAGALTASLVDESRCGTKQRGAAGPWRASWTCSARRWPI